MKSSPPHRPRGTGTPPADATGSSYRSGAVARMLRMPVATLRVWERRYGVTQATLTSSGQRRYSDEDVRRLTLLRQLTEVGHAIGNLASLDLAQLQQVASTHANVLVATQAGPRPLRAAGSATRAWRVAVIGATLASRLQRPAVLRRLGRPITVLGPFADARAAVAALSGQEPADGFAADAVLFHEPHLLGDWRESIIAAAPALAGVPMAVLFGYAAEAVCETLAGAGVALLREPQPDAALSQWLDRLMAAAAPAPMPVPDAAPPRRWNDAALADFAGLSSTIACECPRHVAELLLQLSQFEAYSAACENRSSADAELHAYLRQVAAASRARFEAALETVALHEGLILPS